MVSARARMVLGILVGIVALYFIISQPDQAASIVRQVVAAIGTAIGRIFRFVTQLA